MDTSPTGARARTLAQTEIDWDKLDKAKFYWVGAGLFSGITVALYPVSVIKTRLQVASKNVAHQNAFSVIRSILKIDGIPGLYRGFGTVIIGAIPARIIFMTTLETTKVAALRMVQPIKLSEASKVAAANGVAGMMASLSAQSVFVPMDVISQKLMVQGYSGHATYTGGLDVVSKVLKADGVLGLYRGFKLSVMTYVPSSAVWWATYGSSQRQFRRLLSSGNEHEGAAPSEWKIVGVQATGGFIAGVTTALVTNPLDTIKTRLQVIGDEKKHGAIRVVKELVSEEGWRGLYRGLGPRCFSKSAWGTSTILTYEYLKRLCAKE